MQHNQQLVNLQQALAEALDYVTVHLATGGVMPTGQKIPFDPRCAVLNELRDAMREATFRTERSPLAVAGPNVVALSTHGLALIETPELVAQGGAA